MALVLQKRNQSVDHLGLNLVLLMCLNIQFWILSVKKICSRD